MGYGDSLLATGIARGATLRGKQIAFGDGKKITWDQHSQHVFMGNPNIALPGSEGAVNLEWVAHYKGNRLYNRQVAGRWEWNLDFHATPGEMFFTEQEKLHGRRNGRGFILIEPNVPRWKSVAANKDWGIERYQEVAMRLVARGHRLAQFAYGNEPILRGATRLRTASFRDAVSIMSQAWLYLGPEGGLHHAAAAVGIGAVVLFGGFIPPSVTGYLSHANLTGGAEACGSLQKCEHCRAAMAKISVAEVIDAVEDKPWRAQLSDKIDSTSDERVANNVVRHEYRLLTDEEKINMKILKDLGLQFIEQCHKLGQSRELSLAVTKMEEAVMWSVKHVTK